MKFYSILFYPGLINAGTAETYMATFMNTFDKVILEQSEIAKISASWAHEVCILVHLSRLLGDSVGFSQSKDRNLERAHRRAKH